MKGAKIAVLGAGRSGMAVARAAKARGAVPTVFDEKQISSDIAAELGMLGISAISNFAGRLDVDSFDSLVVSPGVPRKNPILLDAARLGLETIGEIEFAYRISQAPILAITGTNGKSTTTLMTWLCMKACGQEAVLCGNIYGSGEGELTLTEAADRSDAKQVLVAEISSFQLESVRNFRPRCAAITNISEDHLNRYDGDLAVYAAAKRRIFEKMGAGDTIVCDRTNQTTWPSGWQPGKKELNGARIRSYDGNAVRKAVAQGKDVPVDAFSLPSSGFPFREAFNYANAAVAMLMVAGWFAATSKVSEDALLEPLKEGLMQFKPLEHRIERLGSKSGIEMINNSMCTNPAAVVASSSALAAKQHLLMGGQTKELSFAPVAQYLRQTGNKAYLFGQDANLINEQLGGGCPVFRTMADAFAYAVTEAKTGEIVMLAPGCASMDQYKDFTERGEEFRELAKEWLRA